MQEQVFLSDPGVTVTSTKIEIDGQTFATRNVGSVKVTKPGGVVLPAILTLVGITLLIGQEAAGVGIAILAGALVWGWLNLKRRVLVLVSGGGEVNALKSTDGAKIERVRSAISQAISAR
jgi:hypothetical protein